jgi:hypothetical protein
VQTDVDYLRMVLEDGPATTMEIITRSIRERGCGITPHSRAADLRRILEAEGTGSVECRRVGTRNGRGVYRYELTQLRLFSVAS